MKRTFATINPPYKRIKLADANVGNKRKCPSPNPNQRATKKIQTYYCYYHDNDQDICSIYDCSGVKIRDITKSEPTYIV